MRQQGRDERFRPVDDGRQVAITRLETDLAATPEAALMPDGEVTRRLERGDRDRIEHLEPEDPNVPLGARADADLARCFDPDGLQVPHPAWLALDVGQDVPD